MKYTLYRKTHNKTGLRYIGYTSQDPFIYSGSGLYWKRHLDTHGFDITTEILHQTDDIRVIKEMGIYYSKLWNIVESVEYANLKIEEGQGGSNKWSDEQKQKFSETRKKWFLINDNPMKGASRNDLAERNKMPQMWINDGQIEKKVLIEEGNILIASGIFVRGRLPMTYENKIKLRKPKSESHKQALRKPKKNKPITSAQKGKHWYTNGQISVSCFPNEIPDGFVRGRKM
jgi:hypothetical protein